MSLEADSFDLAGELADNDHEATVASAIDPRTIPTRFSLLKLMALSPAHYHEGCQRPQDDSMAEQLATMSPSKTRGEALRFGTAVHLMLLGTPKLVAVFTGKVRRGKEWDQFRAEAADRGCIEIVNQREHALARDVAAAIGNHPVAMKLLFSNTIVEQRLDWSWMGKTVRSTPDALGGTYMVDLKTSITAEPRGFARHGARLFYHAQAALYRQALRELGRPVPSDCYIVAVEKSRPHPVTVLRFDEDALEIGERLIRTWFERLLLCEGANIWPAYVPSPAIADFTIDPPREAFTVEINGERLEV